MIDDSGAQTSLFCLCSVGAVGAANARAIYILAGGGATGETGAPAPGRIDKHPDNKDAANAAL